MKKTIMCSSALIALMGFSSAFAGGPDIVMRVPQPLDYFSGFYVGGDGSFHQSSFDINSKTSFSSNVYDTTIPFTTLNTIDNGGHSLDGYGGVQGGWGTQVFRRYYVGVQGFADFGSASDDASNVSQAIRGNASTDPELNGMISTTQAATGKVEEDYGVVAKLGVFVTPATMFYTKLGVSFADITASQNVFSTSQNYTGQIITTAIANSSDESTKSAFVWGFGGEQFIIGRLASLFGEYTFADYGTVNAPTVQVLSAPSYDTGAVSATNYDASTKVQVSAFTGGFHIYFGGKII